MTIKYEKSKLRKGYSYVIGCDEVGRGSLAGPVVAAAVAIAPASLKLKVKSFKVIKDSKLLSSAQREQAVVVIKQHFLWSIGSVSESIVDEINIHNASLLAMKRAVESLRKNLVFEHSREPKFFLAVDGKFVIPDSDVEQEAIIDGDNKVLSIAAASIIAKVYRDNLMREHHRDYPIYNFAQHKGYATQYHRQMILEHGLSPLHRLSFCGNLAN